MFESTLSLSVLMLAAAAMYCGVVAFTLFLLFKIGSPDVVGQLAKLDGAAKSLAQAGLKVGAGAIGAVGVTAVGAAAGAKGAMGAAKASKEIAVNKAKDIGSEMIQGRTNAGNQALVDYEESTGVKPTGDGEKTLRSMAEKNYETSDEFKQLERNKEAAEMEGAKAMDGLRGKKARGALLGGLTQGGQAVGGVISASLPGGGRGLKELFNANEQGYAQGHHMVHAGGIWSYAGAHTKSKKMGALKQESGVATGAEMYDDVNSAALFSNARDTARREAGEARSTAQARQEVFGKDGASVENYANNAIMGKRQQAAQIQNADIIVKGGKVSLEDAKHSGKMAATKQLGQFVDDSEKVKVQNANYGTADVNTYFDKINDRGEAKDLAIESIETAKENFAGKMARKEVLDNLTEDDKKALRRAKAFETLYGQNATVNSHLGLKDQYGAMLAENKENTAIGNDLHSLAKTRFGFGSFLAQPSHSTQYTDENGNTHKGEVDSYTKELYDAIRKQRVDDGEDLSSIMRTSPKAVANMLRDTKKNGTTNDVFKVEKDKDSLKMIVRASEAESYLGADGSKGRFNETYRKDKSGNNVKYYEFSGYSREEVLAGTGGSTTSSGNTTASGYLGENNKHRRNASRGNENTDPNYTRSAGGIFMPINNNS